MMDVLTRWRNPFQCYVCAYIKSPQCTLFKYLTVLYVVYTSVKLKFYIKKKKAKVNPQEIIKIIGKIKNRKQGIIGKKRIIKPKSSY